MSNKLLLIDGHSMLNRAFYGLPDLTNSEGIHTNAMYGFLNIMFRTLEEEKPDHLAVCFDLHAPTFRHKMYDAYKGTRKAMPEELRQQVPLIREVIEAMDIPVLTLEGYEADDILGTISGQFEALGMDVTILSGDRDLLQLVDDHITVRLPKTIKGKTIIEEYTPAAVMEKFQLTPPQIVDLKSLMGDASDNIPGVPGIGEKTATKILADYQTLENAWEHVDELMPKKAREKLKENYEKAVLSKKLAKICTTAPITISPEETVIRNFYTPKAWELFRRFEFKNFLNRFDASASAGDDLPEILKIEEVSEWDACFAAARQAECVGLALTLDSAKDLKGAAICFSGPEGEVIRYIPVDSSFDRMLLMQQLDELALYVKELSLADVKSMLPYIRIPDRNKVFDPELAAYLLNPLRSSYPYGDIAKEYLTRQIPGAEEIFGNAKVPVFEKQDPEKTLQLAGCAALTAYLAAPVLTEKLKETEMFQLFREVEIPLAFTLYEMEQAGMAVNREELVSYGASLTGRISELEQSIYNQAGEVFNINSPRQLGVILFEKLGLPSGKKTKSGYSTSADILEKLAPESKIVAEILEYRQLAKLKSTYADGLLPMIREDGRIHSTFNQTITATGRISSTDPNLQNIPIRMELGRLIRKCFVPAPGCLFLDADYSQIELRVLASMSGDEKLIAAYREDEDIHKITASHVFHVPLSEVTPLMRRNAKAVNFGIVYGISSFGLGQNIGISRKEAEEYISRYFETYPGIKQFLDRLVSDAKEKGYTLTMLNRRRPMPELKSSNFMQRSFGERVAMNAPIQGTAADIIKIAMVRVADRIKAEGLKTRLVLQVHDELLLEVPEDELEQASRLLSEEMRRAVQLKVDLEIDMHTGSNWYEAK